MKSVIDRMKETDAEAKNGFVPGEAADAFEFKVK